MQGGVQGGSTFLSFSFVRGASLLTPKTRCPGQSWPYKTECWTLSEQISKSSIPSLLAPRLPLRIRTACSTRTARIVHPIAWTWAPSARPIAGVGELAFPERQFAQSEPGILLAGSKGLGDARVNERSRARSQSRMRRELQPMSSTGCRPTEGKGKEVFLCFNVPRSVTTEKIQAKEKGQPVPVAYPVDEVTPYPPSPRPSGLAVATDSQLHGRRSILNHGVSWPSAAA